MLCSQNLKNQTITLSKFLFFLETNGNNKIKKESNFKLNINMNKYIWNLL